MTTYIDTNWIVVTGAPSSGKTTTLSLLKKMGYSIVPDIARGIVEATSKKTTILDSLQY